MDYFGCADPELLSEKDTGGGHSNVAKRTVGARDRERVSSAPRLVEACPFILAEPQHHNRLLQDCLGQRREPTRLRGVRVLRHHDESVGSRYLSGSSRRARMTSIMPIPTRCGLTRATPGAITNHEVDRPADGVAVELTRPPRL